MERKLQKDKDLKCFHCGKQCTRQSSFQRHMRSCKTLTCEVCNMWFPRKWELTRHERKHTGERPYECHVCKERFTQSSILKRHVNSMHILQKNHLCETCGMPFTRKDYLTQHSKIHKNESPCSSNKSVETLQSLHTIKDGIKNTSEKRPAEDVSLLQPGAFSWRLQNQRNPSSPIGYFTTPLHVTTSPESFRKEPHPSTSTTNFTNDSLPRTSIGSFANVPHTSTSAEGFSMDPCLSRTSDDEEYQISPLDLTIHKRSLI